jgi:hypothetical protein
MLREESGQALDTHGRGRSGAIEVEGSTRGSYRLSEEGDGQAGRSIVSRRDEQARDAPPNEVGRDGAPSRRASCSL